MSATRIVFECAREGNIYEKISINLFAFYSNFFDCNIALRLSLGGGFYLHRSRHHIFIFVYEIDVDIHITAVFHMWPMWLKANGIVFLVDLWPFACDAHCSPYAGVSFAWSKKTRMMWRQYLDWRGFMELSAVVRPNDKIEWMWRCGIIRDTTWMFTKKIEDHYEQPQYTGCISVGIFMIFWHLFGCFGAYNEGTNTQTCCGEMLDIRSCVGWWINLLALLLGWHLCLVS